MLRIFVIKGERKRIQRKDKQIREGTIISRLEKEREIFFVCFVLIKDERERINEIRLSQL